MIIQCDRCATRFRLDESRVTGYGVKVRCTKCQNVFIVAPPLEEARIEEVLTPEKGKAPANPPEKEKKEEPRPQDRPKERPAARKPLDNETLKFSFDRPAREGAADVASVGEERSQAPETSFGGPELSFDAKKEVRTAPAPEPRPSGSGSRFEEIDFSFGDDDGGGAGDPSGREGAGDWEMDSGVKEGLNDGIKPASPAAPPAAPAQSAPPAAAGPASPVPDARPSKPLTGGYPAAAGGQGKFEDVLSGSMARGEAAEERAPRVPPHRPGMKYYVVAGAIAVLAGAAFYLSGGADMVAGTLASRSSAVEQVQPVRIDTIRGYFVDNRNIGRVFVIEAWIKNSSDTAQEIKAIRGVLYDKNGAKIGTQQVSPGRVIAMEDIKSMTKDDILKQYKDSSGGDIPPKGAVPVTVVFTDVPKGMVEYGLDIVRGPR